jgi:hypothetical protein
MFDFHGVGTTGDFGRVIPGADGIAKFVVRVNAKRAFITAIKISCFDLVNPIGDVFSVLIDGVPAPQFRDRVFIDKLYNQAPCWIAPIKIKALQTVELSIDASADFSTLVGARIFGFYDYLTLYDYD